MVLHHPDKELWPEWTLDLKNNLFHRVVTIVIRMKPTDKNLMYIGNLVDALEYERLRKRRKLDEND